MSGPGATQAMMRTDSCVSHSARNPSDAASRWRPYPNGYALHELPPLARLLSVLPLAFIITLAACGTTGIKPEDKLVSSVTSLPPVEIPIPVRCVKEVPPIPDIKIDPSATAVQRYFQMKEAILAYEAALIENHALLLACAGKGK